MSRIEFQQPVVHLPSIRRWGIDRVSLAYVLTKQLGLELIYPYGVHNFYYYTNVDGVAKMLPYIIQKSELYSQDVFTCINFSFEVWNIVAKKFKVNTWLPVIGSIPGFDVKHAWNLVVVGDETGLRPELFNYFEPNDGWDMGIELENAYQAFPIGEEGYVGELVFQ